MLVRILNTLRSRIWDRVVFLFSVFAPERMNATVFGREMGEKSEVYYLLERYTVQKIRYSL
ncbi:hypothetical protein [Anaerobutyricum soehngenii]|uniref:hypothetical protein n=1 Tax=Anaerobutyricum soehngenii TaxID=105843 RepID=UPI001ADDA7BE|nr:hypothetical protein [Anaerobutyricum soehngenii]